MWIINTDITRQGRALLVGAAETTDLGDDGEGLDAGPAMKAYVGGEAKGFWEAMTNALTGPPPGK